MNYIGVIDCNNFFVSCERLFRPDLVGKPVMVLSSNDGCVVARSQEVKDIGVMMGVPVFQIKDIIKDNGIVTFSSHFALYRDISSRVFTVVKTLLPTREIYSIDEAFFTISADSKEDLEIELRRIKIEIERQVGIPVSLGVAATKTQAKYANRLAKKAGGVIVLEDSDWTKLVPTIPLQNIWGVGGKLERRYKEAGLRTVADLINCPKPRVGTLFGITGLRLQSELAGTPVYKLAEAHAPQQSIMSSRSFEKNVTELAVIKDAVAYHVRQVVSELRHLRLKTKYITVTLGTSRHGDYLLRGGSLTLENMAPTDDVVVLLKEAFKLVDSLYEPEVPYKKAGVYIGGFSPKTIVQQSLFSDEVEVQTNPINELLDSFSARYGSDAVTIGTQTKERRWQSKSEQKSPAYTTRWSDLAVVKT
jgi:DNA polymerase V